MTSLGSPGWRRVRVGEICKVQRGSSPRPIKDQKYFEGGTIPWIKIADATSSGKYLCATKQKVNEYGASFSRLLPTGSLILAASGTLGYVQMLGVPGCIHDGWLHLYEFDGTDPQFLYYWLRANPHLSSDAAYGAAIQNINTELLRSFEIDLPPLPTQRHMAAILSTYDDLIDNNTRCIAILEEMARRLYEEWFVHFRFPGHESVKMVESELGEVPEEWNVVPAAEVARVIRGRSYKGVELAEEGGLPFVNLKCIDRGGGFRRSGLKRYIGKFKPDQAVQSGDIVMAVTDMTQERRIVARCARVPSLDEKCAVISMDMVKVVPKEGTQQLYLYATFRWSRFSDEVKEHATGVNVLHLHPDRISGFKFALAPIPVQDTFSDLVLPLLNLCENLEIKNANLRTQRDLLLPKLISGEIDVSVIGEQMAEAAAE